jgi:hypothetical protein
MRPVTVGRIVNYWDEPDVDDKPTVRAAIVTQTHGYGSVGLCVISPSSIKFYARVPFSETAEPGHWTWPVHV